MRSLGRSSLVTFETATPEESVNDPRLTAWQSNRGMRGLILHRKH
ncbi:hypothetical protein CKA32_000862 [Geitlerinema sp. FC II]|nr:hypothetical protein CKA32_000862 [Geitlerinema sp. FC II]